MNSGAGRLALSVPREPIDEQLKHEGSGTKSLPTELTLGPTKTKGRAGSSANAGVLSEAERAIAESVARSP